MLGWLFKTSKVAEIRRRVVLITGASTGLGLALVKVLVSTGKFHVIATARQSSLGRFQEAGVVESESLWIRPLDVLSKLQRDAVIAEAVDRLGGVDVLVNNAGYCLTRIFHEI